MDPDQTNPGGFPWLGRGRGLQPVDGAVGSRGLLLSTEGPAPGRARGLATFGEWAVGQKVASPTQEPLFGQFRGSGARGVLHLQADPKVWMEKRSILPHLLPPSGDSLRSPVEEPKIPAAELDDRPVSAVGSSLVSMFKTMGLEPVLSSRGRGTPPVGRGLTVGLEGGKQGHHFCPPTSPESVAQPEGQLGRGCGFGGLPTQRPLGLGRSQFPHLGGRGRAAPPSLLTHAELLSPEGQSQRGRPPQSSLTGVEPTPPRLEGSEPSDAEPAESELRMEDVPLPLNKTGSKGAPITVASNHIPVCCKNDAIYQYHVTFSPNVDSMSMRFGMMREHRSTTGETVAFDGSILYLPVKLGQVVVLKSQRRTDNEEIQIKIQMTKILPPNSDLCIPFYNVVLRRLEEETNISQQFYKIYCNKILEY